MMSIASKEGRVLETGLIHPQPFSQVDIDEVPHVARLKSLLVLLIDLIKEVKEFMISLSKENSKFIVSLNQIH